MRTQQFKQSICYCRKDLDKAYIFIICFSLTNLTLTQQLVPSSSTIQDVPNHSNKVALTTSPVTAAMELDAFDFDDDSTTMTSLEQAKAIEVVMWDYHDEREVSEVTLSHFIAYRPGR